MTLNLGTLNCPADKTKLHFEQVAGMRVKRSDGEGFSYRATCPQCKEFFKVEAPKESP